MSKRQRVTIGSIVEIPIEGGYFTYAQILHKSHFAFFDFKSESPLTDLSVLLSAPVLFIIYAYSTAVTSGRWQKIGKLELRPEFKQLPLQFIQDSIYPDQFRHYNPNTGEIIPTTREQCLGLEACAVWAENHVEDRIRDHYLGVPNPWVLQMQIR